MSSELTRWMTEVCRWTCWRDFMRVGDFGLSSQIAVSVVLVAANSRSGLRAAHRRRHLYRKFRGRCQTQIQNVKRKLPSTLRRFARSSPGGARATGRQSLPISGRTARTVSRRWYRVSLVYAFALFRQMPQMRPKIHPNYLQVRKHTKWKRGQHTFFSPSRRPRT